jgi:hypothetical protein
LWRQAPGFVAGWTRDNRMKPVHLSVACAALVLSAAPTAWAQEAACKAFAGHAVPAGLIALPTTGGRVVSAAFTPGGDEGRAYCKLLGEIDPVDPAAPKIKFQLNLPEGWNSKVVQEGGGGLNGTVVTGEGRLRDAPPGPTPLAQGYATFGTDSGHQTAKGDDPRAFAANEEAIVNYAYAAYKKTHDAAIMLTSLYYGRHPSRVYYFGGSQGGREGMSAVQRFPEDYDGVVSTEPVLSWLGSHIASYGHWQLARNGGWMGADKLKLVEQATVAACDALDGLKDGVIADYKGCNASAAVAALRCPNGEDKPGCLSDPQLALVNLVRSPAPYGYAIANGEASYTPYATGYEAGAGEYNNNIVSAEQTGIDELRGYGVGNIRSFIVKDPTYSAPLDLIKYKTQIEAASKLFDMTDPDLSRFQARGGKLILKSNAADYVVSPASVWRYYQNVVAKMGQAKADRFVRLYVAPYTSHGGSGVSATTGEAVPDKVDLLSVLDAWVESGQAPPDSLTLTAYSKSGQAGATWPMCRYPAYPRYQGSGDPKAASSFACSTP